MPVNIKSPNPDDIWDAWKRKYNKSQELEKNYGIKGAVFNLDDISAAEFVKGISKAALIYFEIDSKVKTDAKKGQIQKVPIKKLEDRKFYLLSGAVEKANWKGDTEGAMFNTISHIPCKTCSGAGFIKKKCGTCDGKGKANLTVNVYNEKNEKTQKQIPVKCSECFGTGFSQVRCSDCGGFGESAQYQVQPIPFKGKNSTVPVLLTSAKITGFEKEIGKDIEDAIDNVEGINIRTPEKELDPKAVEPKLGYMDSRKSRRF